MRLEVAAGQAVHRVHEEAGADAGQPVAQRARIVVLVDGLLGAQQHRAGVHALVHSYGGDAGDGEALEQRALHGGCAAELRQQREVQVDRRDAREAEHRARQDLPVGHDGEDVGFGRADRVEPRARSHRWRLDQLEAEPTGRVGDRRRRELRAATGRFRFAGSDQDDVVFGLGQRLERRHGPPVAAQEDHAQRVHRGTAYGDG